MPPIVKTWLAGEKYCGSLRWFLHNRHMIRNIAHHLHIIPIIQEHIMTHIVPIIITCSMSCISMAMIIILLNQ